MGAFCILGVEPRKEEIMDEETIIVDGSKIEPEPKVEPDKKVEAEEDKVESLAKEMGWQPKDNFKGEEYVDAAEYIRKGQDIQDGMRKSLKDQKKQLSDMSGSITELKQHNERVYKAEVSQLKKELSDLAKQKKTAIEDGDVDKVGELDEQIDTVKESMTPLEKSEKAETTPEFEDWVGENDWYLKDAEMAAYADTLSELDQYKGAPFGRMSALVTRQVKEMFPDKFSQKKSERTPISRVEGGDRKTTSIKFTKSDLTDSQKSIMSQFVKQGIMSEKQYIEDIAKVAGGAI